MLFLKKRTSVFRAARVVDTLTYRVWTCVGCTGAAEDECSTEQGSGCLFIIPPRTAPHCSFVLCHLETNTLARASFHQRPQTHVKKKCLPASNINKTPTSTYLDRIHEDKVGNNQHEKNILFG